jgi:nonsense-mediated mRNA decay protein 3
VTVLWCKECGRYLQPPKHWLRAELESKELLTFCIKKIKGLNKVRGWGQFITVLLRLLSP